MLWLLVPTAMAFRVPSDPCSTADLVAVATVTSRAPFFKVAPGTNPRYPQGKIYTTITLDVDRLVLDSHNLAVSGEFQLSIPGGTIGTQSMQVPEFDAFDIGDQYAIFAAKNSSGTIMLIQSHYIDPSIVVPPENQLVAEWEANCAN